MIIMSNNNSNNTTHKFKLLSSLPRRSAVTGGGVVVSPLTLYVAAGAVVGIGMVLTYKSVERSNARTEQALRLLHETKRAPGENDLMLSAMLEVTRESSWKDNLKHAIEAQEFFMVPGRKGGETSQVMQRIRGKRDEIQLAMREKERSQEEVIIDEHE